MHELPHRLVERRLLSALAVVVLTIVEPTPHAQADAPPCRTTISTDTVFDKDTGLTWQRAVDAATYNQSDAMTYCSDLVLAGVGWRLPSIKELQTIVDESKYNPAIDPIAFPDTPINYFWSSSLYAGDSGSAWYVAFNVGYVYYDSVDTTLRVRCVRRE